MKWEPLHSGSLRVWLTSEEAHRFELDAPYSAGVSAVSARAVGRLLLIARRRRLLPPRGRITVEHLPLGEGCILLLTPDALPAVPPPLIFSAQHAERFLQLGEVLNRRELPLPCSSLFRWRQGYCLIVYPTADDPLVRLITEYAELQARGTVAAAHIEEYGHPLIIGTALEKLRGSLPPPPPHPVH